MAVYGVRRGASLASWEAGEPLSWILAIAAMVFAVEGQGPYEP